MIEELDRVVLNRDFPDDGLKEGDIGTVVMVHEGGKGFEIEFVALTGETVTVITVNADQIREARANEIARARSIDLSLAS